MAKRITAMLLFHLPLAFNYIIAQVADMLEIQAGTELYPSGIFCREYMHL